MSLCNVEHDLSLTALVASTFKISLTNLRASYTNSFLDAFNVEIIVMTSFIPSCFPSIIWVKVLSWVSNLNWCRSLLKNEDICWSSWWKSSSCNAFKSSIYIFWRISMWYFCWNLLRIQFQLVDKKMEEVFLKFR